MNDIFNRKYENLCLDSFIICNRFPAHFPNKIKNVFPPNFSFLNVRKHLSKYVAVAASSRIFISLYSFKYHH